MTPGDLVTLVFLGVWLAMVFGLFVVVVVIRRRADGDDDDVGIDTLTVCTCPGPKHFFAGLPVAVCGECGGVRPGGRP